MRNAARVISSNALVLRVGEKRVRASLGCALPVPFFRNWRLGEQRATRRVASTVNTFIIGQRHEGRESGFPPCTGAGNGFPAKTKRHEL